MNYSIVFSSATGNTAAVADRLRGFLPEKDCVYFGEPSAKALEASFLFAGFWTDKGTCDEKMQAFLKTLSGKTVALFGTAGFGSDDAYFSRVLENVQKEIPSGNTVAPGFMCQGRMQPSVRARYEKMLEADPSSARVRMFLENFDAALSHPDQEDYRKLSAWVQALSESRLFLP